MPNKKPLILELNNIDILGRKFNGYDLFCHLKNQKQFFKIRMLVNDRLSYYSKAKPLFRSSYTEECDWIVQAAEKKFLSTKNQLSLAEEALKNNPLYKKADVLHFHLYHNMNLPIEFLTRIPKTKKIIIDIHDTFWLSDRNIPMLEVFRFTDINQKSLFLQRQRVLNSINAHFIVHSPYILNLFHNSYATKNIKNVHFINFVIDFSIFKPFPKPDVMKIREKLNIPKNNIVLLCRSQREFKGLDYVIGALKLLDASYPITIITVTNTNMLDEFKDKYQIIDAGTLFDEHQMAELFNASDIFLSPSTEESFGFMAVEAMACGKPVIVFEGTALPDTTNAPKIGLVTKQNAKSLKEAIEKLINNPKECKRSGKLGLEFARKNYDEKTYYKEYQKLFEKIIDSPVPKNKPTISAPSPKKPNNLDALKDALSLVKKEVIQQKTVSLHHYKYPIIDYNNPYIQKELQSFNSELYKTIENHHKLRHIVYTSKRYIPDPAKKVIKRTQSLALAPARIIYHIIWRKKS